MIHFSVRRVRSGDEKRLERWLATTEKAHIGFAASDLSDWLTTRCGFVAEHVADPVGLLLYAETSGDTVSIIGLALADEQDEGEIITGLFGKALHTLSRRGITTLRCVTDETWVGDALRHYLGFEFRGKLASYLKVDLNIPELGESDVRIEPASTADTHEILLVDKAAFPSLWQQDEPAILASLRPNGFLLKAEWRGVLVGYIAGTRNETSSHISRLAVHPQVQGLGIGKRLLADSIVKCHWSGIHRITLNTQADNAPSQRLYEEFGFQMTNCDTQVFTKTIRDARDGGSSRD